MTEKKNPVGDAAIQLTAPSEIIAAAVKIGRWAEEHNIKTWKIGPCQSRIDDAPAGDAGMPVVAWVESDFAADANWGFDDIQAYRTQKDDRFALIKQADAQAALAAKDAEIARLTAELAAPESLAVRTMRAQISELTAERDGLQSLARQAADATLIDEGSKPAQEPVPALPVSGPVPAGWQLVPVEPTGPMLSAVELSLATTSKTLGRYSSTHSAYYAMLDVAPKPPAEPVESSWQLIETAPKNGDEIDLWSKWGRIPGCIWSVTTYGRKTGFVYESWRDSDGQVWELVPEPTHWMPLPKPPADKGAAQ